MFTEFLLDLSNPRQWQLDLARQLEGVGSGVGLRSAPPGRALPPSIERLFGVEAVLHGLSRHGPLTPIEPSRLDPYRRAQAPDLSIDLTGGAEGDWSLKIDTRPALGVEGALATAAIERRCPVVTLRRGGAVIAAARLGTERGGIARACTEDWLLGLIGFIAAAVRGARPLLGTLPDDAVLGEPTAIGQRDAAERALKAAVGQSVRLAYRLLTRSPHWRVGWRRLAGPDMVDLRAIPPGWNTLPDDGLRFYADPFFATQAGTTALFVEEFPHRTGKGVISAVRFGPDGPLGTPEPVLETDTHLSYPQVFERDGATWMIPETVGADGIDLYRCTAFPSGWRHHARLVDGVAASDATLVEAGGLLWLFATVRSLGGCYSDALHLWWAERLEGPWTAHDANPVLIDIAAARPAGAFVRRGGALLRPVQDCRRGYGAALAIARVTRLDRTGFAQVVETQLAPGPNWPGRRLHTLNAGGGFEAIDGSALTPRLPVGRRRAPTPR